MVALECPYLGSPVALSEERWQHIVERHPEIGAAGLDLLRATVAAPAEVRADVRASAKRLFVRRFDTELGGNSLVAVVASAPGRGAIHHWVVTAAVARRPRQGVTEWRQG